MRRVSYTIRVDEELLEEFRRRVVTLYGRGYGVMGKAMEEAMRLWLEKHKEVGEG